LWPELRRILDDLPGLSGVLDRAGRRYVQLSRVGGTVEVQPAERRAVERLGCRVEPRGRVKLSELDRAFRASRLEAGLPAVLEAYLGESLVTRRESRGREDAAWLELMARLSALDVPAWVDRWLQKEESTLRAEWRRHDDSWPSGLQAAVSAAAALEEAGEGTELPRLAYRTCGDAHALDSDRTAGRLFERLLLHRHSDVDFSSPLSAEDRESLFAMSGLAVDELSSTVHVVGLLGTDHLVSAARAGRHVLALPLRTLYAIKNDVRAYRDVVFAVENRSVLSVLHRQLAEAPVERYPTLVCTGGHLSLATLRLLDRLIAGGAVVWYSGDFDAKGLMIADGLASRYGDALELWRMNTEAFHQALGGRRRMLEIDPGRFSRGAAARFPELRRAIGTDGAAYQEGLADLLLEDVRCWISDDAPRHP
jgi:uncharacterized protein (TIGR02679 family)